MKVVNAHKGIRSFRTTVTGREAHSSQTDKGVNAVMVGGRTHHLSGDLAEEMRKRGDPSGRFDPPYTTMQVVGDRRRHRAEHSGAPLHVPMGIPLPARHATRTRSIERFDAHAREHVLPRLQRIAPEADIVTTPRSRVPPLDAARRIALPKRSRASSPAATAARPSPTAPKPAYSRKRASRPSSAARATFSQAHKPNEFIELSQVDACVGLHAPPDRSRLRRTEAARSRPAESDRRSSRTRTSR